MLETGVGLGGKHAVAVEHRGAQHSARLAVALVVAVIATRGGAVCEPQPDFRKRAANRAKRCWQPRAIGPGGDRDNEGAGDGVARGSRFVTGHAQRFERCGAVPQCRVVPHEEVAHAWATRTRQAEPFF